MSRERHKLAEAEAVSNVEGNMCGAAMRGADALPWSKTPSRSKGSRRNLGGPAFDRWAHCPQGPHRKGEEPSPMMHERGTSGPVIVAVKPTNKAERSAAELVERRAGAKGNAEQQSTFRTPSRSDVIALRRIPNAAICSVPVITRGGSRMRESRTYGSVRGALSNERPYRDRRLAPRNDKKLFRRCRESRVLQIGLQPRLFCRRLPDVFFLDVAVAADDFGDAGELC